MLRRGALTREDELFVLILETSSWELFTRAVLGRWCDRCNSIESHLTRYGLGRN